MKRHTVALLPARGGSKSVHRKNIQPIGGMPMMAYGITAACACKYIDEVYVSSDDEEFLDIAKLYGAKPIHRPDKLATDSTTTEEVVNHFIDKVHSQNIVLIQPTSPMLLAEDLDGAMRKFIDEKLTCLFSAAVTNDMLLWEGEPLYPLNYDPHNRGRRQTRKREILIENGAFFIFARKPYLAAHCRICGKHVGYYEMPYWRSFQVDSKADLQAVRTLMTTKGAAG